LTIGCVETDFGLYLFPPIGNEGAIERVFMPHEAFTSFTLGSHIGKVLVEHQVVTAQQVEQAAEEQNYLRNRKLGDYLLDTAVLFPEQLMQALAQQSKMPGRRSADPAGLHQRGATQAGSGKAKNRTLGAAG